MGRCWKAPRFVGPTWDPSAANANMSGRPLASERRAEVDMIQTVRDYLVFITEQAEGMKALILDGDTIKMVRPPICRAGVAGRGLAWRAGAGRAAACALTAWVARVFSVLHGAWWIR